MNKNTTIHFYHTIDGIPLYCIAEIEPAQDGGRDDPSWKAYADSLSVFINAGDSGAKVDIYPLLSRVVCEDIGDEAVKLYLSQDENY